MNMTRIEAIIQPSKLEAVKKALIDLGVEGMTVSEVYGHGRSEERIGIFRGQKYRIDFLPSLKLELVLTNDQVEDAVDVIVKNAGTGKVGDGKIFLSRVDDAVRIRNEQRGVAAL